jgi:hypothetical protein
LYRRKLYQKDVDRVCCPVPRLPDFRVRDGSGDLYQVDDFNASPEMQFWNSFAVWCQRMNATDHLQAWRRRPANLRLSTRSHETINTLFASRPDGSNLVAQVTNLTNHRFGDILMELIRLKISAYEGAVIRSSGTNDIVHPPEPAPSPIVIAAHVASNFLACVSVGIDFGTRLGFRNYNLPIDHWQQLFRLKGLLWKEARDDHPWFNESHSENRCLVSRSSANFSTLLGIPEPARHHVAIEYEHVQQHSDGTEYGTAPVTPRTGLLFQPFMATMLSTSHVQFILNGSHIEITEHIPGSVKDCRVDRDQGVVEYTLHDGSLFRMRRRDHLRPMKGSVCYG